MADTGADNSNNSNSMWMWILAAVVIAIILVIIFAGDDEPAEPEIEVDPVGMVEPAPFEDIGRDIPVIA